MFDPRRRNIAMKRHVWPSVMRGALMRLFLDTETYGFTRSDVPYATPDFPALTEYGDALGDLAYNYLNSAQIFPRRPPWLLAQPAAIILQRLKNGPADLDDLSRPNYWTAMANIAWRIEQASFAYDQFGDEKNLVSLIDHNSQFKGGKKKAIESVVNVPLLDENGQVCNDVRYHHERRKVAYRFDRNASSPYYAAYDNLFYVDEADGSLWRWVQPTLNIHIFNGRYDIPILRANLGRVGFDPQDTTLLYARAAPGSRQNPRNHVIDVRHEIYAAALYGPQGEDAIKLGKLVDPVTGKVRTSEAQSAFLEAMSFQPNFTRFLRGGAFMPHDGGKHDKALDHGAAYDSLGAMAASALCAQRAPGISAIIAEQADDDRRRRLLLAHTPDENSLPIFSLPRRQNGRDHSEQPYWYIGNDDQAGHFKNHVFMLVDGTLHNRRYMGKQLHELNTEEWRMYLTGAETRGNPDRAVRLEKLRYMPPAIPIDKVLRETSQAARYRTALPDIKTDCKYIGEHPEMVEHIRHALGAINHARRFDNPIPQVPMAEDEWPTRYSGVAYQQELDEILRRRFDPAAAQIVPLVAETIKNGMNNTYNFMSAIDRAGRKLCLRAHIIDDFIDCEIDDDIHEHDEHAQRALEDFTKLCNDQYANIYRKKNCSYDSILDEIKKPDGAPYFFKGKFQAETVGEALDFRAKLGLRALQDYDHLLKRGQSSFIDGLVGKDFCRQEGRGRKLFLFADPDNGEKGATPHIVDKDGRELPLSYLLSVEKKEFFHRLIDTNEWDYRFFRLRSEPTILQLAHRFVILGKKDQLPSGVRQLYEADFQRRLHGFPNETVMTARAPTLHTVRHEIIRLQQGSTARDDGSLEREPNPMMSEAFGVLRHDEGQRLLAATDVYYAKMLKDNPANDNLWRAGAYDPALGLPFDYIPYVIDRDAKLPLGEDKNFVMVDVPLWHAIKPLEQMDADLPHRGLVIPPMERNAREAVNRRGKPVLVHIPETGQIYSTGVASVQFLPRHSQSRYDNLMQRADSDYAQAGRELAGRGVDYLGVEGLYPVAGTRRNLNHTVQTLKLPNVQFYGLVAPRFVGLDTPVTAVVVPVDYAPQQMTVDAPLRLRQMDAGSYANLRGEDATETGHTYETTLRHVIGEENADQKRGITVERLLRLANGEDSDLRKMLEGAGILGPDHLRKMLADWTSETWKTDPDQQRVMVLAFDQVSPDSWAMLFHNAPVSGPKAAFRYDGAPVSPSVYRPLLALGVP